MQRPGEAADPPVAGWPAPAEYPPPGGADAPPPGPAHPAPAAGADGPGEHPGQGAHPSPGGQGWVPTVCPSPYSAPAAHPSPGAVPDQGRSSGGVPDQGRSPGGIPDRDRSSFAAPDQDRSSGGLAGAYPAGPGPVSYPGAGDAVGPYGTPGLPPYPPAVRPPRVRLWPPTRAELATALAALLGLALAGALLGLLWEQLAPRLAFRVDQPGRALPVVPEAEEYVAADGRFVLLTLAAGIVAGLACWLVRRSRGPLVLLALAAGGLLGAVLTWRVGVALGTGYSPADLQQVGNVVYQPLTLRARAGLVVEPLAAVLAYLFAVGFSARNDLGRPEPEVSSGSG